MSNLSFEDYKKKYSQNLEETVEVKGEFDVLWYGFESSVIYNKLSGKQEFVRNSSINLPNRQRYTYKFR